MPIPAGPASGFRGSCKRKRRRSDLVRHHHHESIVDNERSQALSQLTCIAPFFNPAASPLLPCFYFLPSPSTTRVRLLFFRYPPCLAASSHMQHLASSLLRRFHKRPGCSHTLLGRDSDRARATCSSHPVADNISVLDLELRLSGSLGCSLRRRTVVLGCNRFQLQTFLYVQPCAHAHVAAQA